VTSARSLAAALLAAALLAACGTRYRIVDGPAELNVAGSAFTPSVTAKIEAGGRAWFGPQPPPPPAPAAPPVSP
jgi:hypothetical protein